MKTVSCRVFAICLLVSVFSSSSFAGVLALTNFSPGQLAGSRSDNKTWGWQFKPTGNIEVDALGAWDYLGQNGSEAGFRAGSHRVGIWNQARDLVAEVTVKSDSKEIGGNIAGGVFRFEDLATPVVLPKDEIYVIGMTMDPDDFYTLNRSVSLNAILDSAFSGKQRVSTASGFDYPLGSSTGIGYFGPNFTFKEVPTEPIVPEPNMLAIFAVGAIAVCGGRRRRKR